MCLDEGVPSSHLVLRLEHVLTALASVEISQHVCVFCMFFPTTEC